MVPVDEVVAEGLVHLLVMFRSVQKNWGIFVGEKESEEPIAGHLAWNLEIAHK